VKQKNSLVEKMEVFEMRNKNMGRGLLPAGSE
jgi:hypothetical protein